MSNKWFTQGNIASLAIQNVLSENSNQTAQMIRLICISSGHTCPKGMFSDVAHAFNTM